MLRDPFTPTFGRTPPALAGRRDILAHWRDALEQGPGSFGRAALLTGPRGCGKTVMLNKFEDIAQEMSWVVVSETATEGLLERLTRHRLPEALEQVDPGGGRRRELLGVTLPAWLGGGGVATSVTDARGHEMDARAATKAICRLLAPDQGFLITLDEVHAKVLTDLRQVATLVQHGVREGQNIAFAAAGLPSAVSDVLHDEPLTFLRRADRHSLVALPDYAVREALAIPARDAGLPFEREALNLAVAGAKGYAFLTQLIGSAAFGRAVRAGHAVIEESDVQSALPYAQQIMARNVHEPALQPIPAGERAYLEAMTADDGPSHTGTIASRLGLSAQHANVVRTRLLDSGVIEAPRRGLVQFCLPYLREYLCEQMRTD